jgi:hypothetical protein
MVMILLTVVLTTAYCFLVLLGEGVYAILLPPDIARDLSLPWRIALGFELPFPWHSLPWQLPAVFSMCWVLLGTRSRFPAPVWPLDRRLLAHSIVVLTLICLLGITMILPLVNLVPVLNR